jgi:hypothetical protein
MLFENLGPLQLGKTGHCVDFWAEIWNIDDLV